MGFCMKIFKSHKSVDFPDIGSVIGKGRKNDADFLMTNGHIIMTESYYTNSSSNLNSNKTDLKINSTNSKSNYNNTTQTLNTIITDQSQIDIIEQKSQYSPTFSAKIRRKKPKKCVKVAPTSPYLSDENNDDDWYSGQTNSQSIVEVRHKIFLSKLHEDLRREISGPPRPLRKQISTSYEEIESINNSTENIHLHSNRAKTDHIKSIESAQQLTEETYNGKSDSGIVSDEIEEAKRSKETEFQNDTSERISEESHTSPRKTEELLQNELSPPSQQVGRKEGVISDHIEEPTHKDLNIEFFKKNSETEEFIRKAICSNDFLHNMMSTESLNIVIQAMFPMKLEANSFIVKEGDDGDRFFVSADGDFEVVRSGEVKKKFGAGEVFGELAILYKARRFASIRAITPAKVWALERKVFRKIMIGTGNQEREQNIKFLSSVPVLKGLPMDVLQKIVDLLNREFYPTGSTIIRQGDPGDKFYIIRGGRVTVVKKTNKENRVVAILKRGDYFGEQALISEDGRLASVIAQEPGTECLTLDRIAFNNYLGTIAELKKRPVDRITEAQEKRSTFNKDYEHIQLEDLDVIGTLGVGGFGRVELVQYKKKQTFALKILKKYDVACQGQIEHAYSEKETMAICDSPFIVKLYNTYRNNKYLYFLMEACLGGDVWSQLQKVKCFDDKTAKFVTGCVVESFDYLHSRNIIYRDLKPENLMLDHKGYVKLVDFGFAKRIAPANKTWTFAGTPEYVAPEIILNKGHDRAADYWAMGVLIHELLIGKPPFRGKGHMKTYSLILRGIDIVPMPTKISKSSVLSLIKGLCRQVPTDRIGYQKKGINDIRNHTWFDGFEWEKLRNGAIVSPLKTVIKNNTDLSNFEIYPKDRDDPPDDTTGWDINF